MDNYKKNLGKIVMTPEGAWDISKKYEFLSLVYEDTTNRGFISKQDVPIGVDIHNKEYWMPFNVSGYAESNIIALAPRRDDGQIQPLTLIEAITSVAEVARKPGVILCFYNNNEDRNDAAARWEIWQFDRINIYDWENPMAWTNLYHSNDKFAGWYTTEEALLANVPYPQVGSYAHVGNDKPNTFIYRCEEKGKWINTEMYAYSDGSALAQQPGQNVDIAMSQKAVTDYVKALEEKFEVLNEQVNPFSIESASTTMKFETGSIANPTFKWSYNKDITSQSFDGENLDIAIREITKQGLTQNTSYSLKAVSVADKEATKQFNVKFALKKYWGTSANEKLSNAEILAMSKDWADNRTLPPTEFNCEGGKYIYYIVPTELASGIQFWIGGLRNTDWEEVLQEVNNNYNYKATYSVFRLMNKQNANIIIEVK